MSELSRALDEFRVAMLLKFEARDAKQGATSVTREGNLDRLDECHVETHYYEEMAERGLAGTDEEKAGEDVDVANMAFLDWYIRRKRSP